MNDVTIIFLIAAIYSKLHDPLAWIMLITVIFAALDGYKWKVALALTLIFTVINIKSWNFRKLRFTL